MKVKRKILSEGGPLEPWLEWHIRSHRLAGGHINRMGINVFDKLHALKEMWAGHISRFGLDHKEPHPLKVFMAWRCKAWWLEQVMYNDLNWNPVKHAAQQGRPKRWEEQFSSNWMTVLASNS